MVLTYRALNGPIVRNFPERFNTEGAPTHLAPQMHMALHCRWFAICGATQSKSSQLPDSSGGLFRSMDSGHSWTRIFDGGPVRLPS